jgi:hypothetical protein
MELKGTSTKPSPPVLSRISEVLWSRNGGMKKGDIAFLHTKNSACE